MSKNNHKIAIVPGSFDPMTLGHRALVEQVCQRYQTVYVAVMTNFAKHLFAQFILGGGHGNPGTKNGGASDQEQTNVSASNHDAPPDAVTYRSIS